MVGMIITFDIKCQIERYKFLVHWINALERSWVFNKSLKIQLFYCRSGGAGE